MPSRPTFATRPSVKWSVSTFLTLVVCSALGLPSLRGQTPLTEHIVTAAGAKSPPATLADIAWLAGHWEGKGLDGTVEEQWTPPKAGAMLGTFRLIQDGKPVFYELCLLAEENGSLVYKVKHFSPQLEAWEDKKEFVRFPLVKMTDGVLYFDGLTIERTPDGSRQYVAMRNADGKYREMQFEFRSADATPAAAAK